MCHPSVLAFGQRVLTAEHVRSLDVLEVGSYNVNGSLRDHVIALMPSVYWGVDLRAGPGVDTRMDIAAPLLRTDEVGWWDLLICTEVLEHVADWRAAVTNLKALLKPGGYLLLTTRSLGFPLHEYPGDHWRFELWDLATIFRDFIMDVLEPDPEAPGVFLFAMKPLVAPPPPADLTTMQMHSMATGARAL